MPPLLFHFYSAEITLLPKKINYLHQNLIGVTQKWGQSLLRHSEGAPATEESTAYATARFCACAQNDNPPCLRRGYKYFFIAKIVWQV